LLSNFIGHVPDAPPSRPIIVVNSARAQSTGYLSDYDITLRVKSLQINIQMKI
jgi:hypothetical protein